MVKCDRCGINPKLVERYCRFVYGKRQCYKKDIVPTLQVMPEKMRILDDGRVIGFVKDNKMYFGEVQNEKDCM